MQGWGAEWAEVEVTESPKVSWVQEQRRESVRESTNGWEDAGSVEEHTEKEFC